MSDTPRTDAEEQLMRVDCHDKQIEGQIVAADFARELERELNASKQAPADNDTWNSLLESRAKLERELRESRAREAQLREALEYIRDVLQTEINMGNYGDDDVRRINDESIDAGRKAEKALTLPAPPVVPSEDVRPLVDALSKIVQERFYPMSKRLKTDAWIAQDALSTFTAKHKL